MDGDEGTRYALAYNYDFPKNKVQLYAGVSRFSMDRSRARTIDDVTTVIIGSRIKF